MNTLKTTSSDTLSVLVEVNFDKTYLVRMMAGSPEGSLYHALYECLYEEDTPAEVLTAANERSSIQCSRSGAD